MSNDVASVTFSELISVKSFVSGYFGAIHIATRMWQFPFFVNGSEAQTSMFIFVNTSWIKVAYFKKAFFYDFWALISDIGWQIVEALASGYYNLTRNIPVQFVFRIRTVQMCRGTIVVQRFYLFPNYLWDHQQNHNFRKSTVAGFSRIILVFKKFT